MNVITAVPEAVPTHAGTIALSTGGRSLHEMEKWLEDLRAFIRKVLVKGVDYGVVPSVKQPFLWKAGSEKLMLLYNLAAEFVPIEADTLRDWNANPPHIQYAFRCDLYHRGTGTKVGEGVGSASSWEKKHRYRDEWWPTPQTPPPADQGWKKTSSGYVRKNINPDISDVINTLMKIARKRAQIDAVLRATATSEIFTQDEDAPRDDDADRGPSKAEADEIEKKVSEVVVQIEKVATADALATLATEIAKLGKPIAKHARVRAAYKKRHHELKPTAEAGAAESKPKQADQPKSEDAKLPFESEAEPDAPEYQDPGPEA